MNLDISIFLLVVLVLQGLMIVVFMIYEKKKVQLMEKVLENTHDVKMEIQAIRYAFGHVWGLKGGKWTWVEIEKPPQKRKPGRPKNTQRLQNQSKSELT